MSIERATKLFDYIDGGGYKMSKTFISPGAPWGQVVAGQATVSIQPDDMKTDPAPNNGGGYTFVDLLTPKANYEEYYFGKSDSFNLGDKLVQGIGKSLAQLRDSIIADIDASLASNRGSDSAMSYLNTQYASKAQGMWGENNAYAHPYIQWSYSGNTFNPSTFKRTVNVYITIRIAMPSQFNDSTGVWVAEPAFNNLYSCFCIGIYSTNVLKEAFDKILTSAQKFYLKPSAGFGVVPASGGWAFGKGSDFAQKVWYWGLLEGSDPFLEQLVTTSALMPLRGNVTRSYTANPQWNSSGTVDPDPPEPEPGPDPDEPLPPPKPGPDDPPRPVDPVDPVPEPGDPSLDGTNCGIYSVYNPSRTALRQLGEKLWDPNVWEIIKQHFTSPMEALLSLSIIPVPPSTSGTEAIVIGNYNSHVGAPVVNSDYVTFNCGSVYIPKFFGSYLDYDPYTTYKLYLPFIGEVDLNADEITAERITIKYKVNVVSGDCVALCMKRNNVFAEFNGNCARFLPLSQASWAAFVQAAATFASAAIVGGVALAGSGATGEAIESSIGTTKNGEIRAAANVAQQQSIGANIASSGINAVVGSKISYNKAGRVGQSAGQISVRTPYITVTRPNLTLPENIDQASSSALRNYIGYPTNRIGQLNSFHGFTVIEACQLNSQHATEEELAEALEIMKGGVIL